MYNEDVICFFVNKLTPSLMTQESIWAFYVPQTRHKNYVPQVPQNEAQK